MSSADHSLVIFAFFVLYILYCIDPYMLYQIVNAPNNAVARVMVLLFPEATLDAAQYLIHVNCNNIFIDIIKVSEPNECFE